MDVYFISDGLDRTNIAVIINRISTGVSPMAITVTLITNSFRLRFTAFSDRLVDSNQALILAH